ncbi:MAG: DUF1302 family protein [Candidatus Caldatribacteriaceae bacterium]
MKRKAVAFIVVSCLFLAANQIACALETQGYVKASGFYSFTEGDLDWRVMVDASATQDLGKGYFFNAELLLKYQDENNIRPFQVQELGLQGVQVPWGETDFKVGLLTLTWGASDVMSPVDVVNPRPFSRGVGEDALKDKIPVPALDVEWYFSSSWSLELLYQPRFVANFVPDFVEGQMLLPSLVPFGVDLTKTGIELTKEEPAVGFLSPIWALRARGNIGSTDVALSFYQGYFLSAFPRKTVIAFLPDGTSEISATLGYPRRSVLGLEFQGTLSGVEGMTFRGDVAVIFPESWVNVVTVQDPSSSSVTTIPIFDAPYLKASLGVDYTHENHYVNLAYLLGNPWEEGDSVSSYLYAHYDWKSDDEKWNPFVNSFLSLEDGSMVNIVGTQYKPGDNWSVSFALSFSSGAPESRLNVGDGVSLEVKYSF